MLLQYLTAVARKQDRLGFTRKKFVEDAAYELAITEDEADYLYNRLVGRNLIHIAEFTDEQRRDFLDKLDDAPVELTAWELGFVANTLGWMSFTIDQRRCIDQMIHKWRDIIRW